MKKLSAIFKALYGHHEHNWTHDYNWARQTCDKCSVVRILIEHPYPSVGQPKYEWQILDVSKLRF